MRRSLIALSTIVPVVVGVASCGGTSRTTRTASVFASAPDNDRGYDHPGKGEQDDNASLYFGHVAAVAETHTIARIVRRYYRAAAVGDGASACSLIYSVMAAAVPVTLGRAPGPKSLRGNTCATVVSKLFKQHHATLAAERARLKIAAVRVDGEQAVALLKLGSGPQRFIPLRRDRGVWKLGSLLDNEIP